jgi:hypothetical protein
VRKDLVYKRKNSLSSGQCTRPQKCFGNGKRKLKDLHYELLERSPFSPDLATPDFCLFPKLKLFLAGQRFSSNQEATAAVDGVFCRSCEEPLQERDNGAGASLE